MRDAFLFGGGLSFTIQESDSLDGRVRHGFEAPQSFFVVPDALGSADLISGQGESATPGSTLADEVAFIGGVFPDGSMPLYTYYSWNGDQPATYTGGFTNTAKWGAPTAGTTGGTVLYYFDPNSAWTPTEQQALSGGLALWSAVANVSFAQTTTAAQAQITFTRGNDGQAATTPHETGPPNAGQTGGTLLLTLTSATVSIDTSVPGFGPLNGNFTTAGGYAIETVLHEEGHAIGLGHAGPYNVSVNDAVQQFGPFDSRLWSIMSYIAPNDTGAEYFNQYAATGTNWGVGPDGSANEPTTWMPADILAAQALYGLPSSTPLSGGQIFGFNTNITGAIEPFFDFTKNTNPIVTLWDLGTGNTLDVSGFSQAAKVDLFAGAFSSVDGMTNNIAIAFNTAIDGVVGGPGSDTIIANNDGDTLTGGSGNDTLIGGTGSDTVVYSGNRANYSVSYNASTQTFTVTDTRSGSPDGTDTVTGVENFRFADGTVSATSLIDQPPVLAGAGNTVVYTEQAVGVVIAAALSVSDPDSSTLASAIVTISGGFLSGDSLNFTNQNGITGSYNTSTGTLSLSGVSSVMNYQAALESVKFSSTSDNPTNFGADTTRIVSWQTSDGSASSNSVSSTINVTAVNDPPALSGAGNMVAFTPNGTGVLADASLVVGDVDSTTFSGATVVISSGYLSGDNLGFTSQSGITGSFNATTHTLTLSGTASVQAYQTALRSVSFSSSSNNPSNSGADTARTLTWQVDDGAPSNHASNTVTSNVAIAHVTGDFNGDGKSDILWQNDNGTTAEWLMNGLSLVGSGAIAANAAPAWHIQGTGDFNGDGKSDIVWQNDDGTAAVWLMNGLNLLGGSVIGGGNPGPAWHIQGVGDFNGDGNSDVLWQNDDGTTAEWLMNGLSLVGSGAIAANASPAWHIKGVGDFNGDGKSDIVWQNDDGTAAVWLMNGPTLLASSVIGGGNPGPTWHIQGVGDFNGDGKSDIVWQNDDGTAAVWLMNGLTLLAGGVVGGGNPGPTWHIKGVGDFNGDGKSDIVWQNDDGTTAVWLMNGLNLIGGNVIGGGNPGPAWHIEGQGAVDSSQVHVAGASDALALAGAPSAGTMSNDSAAAGLSSHGSDTLTAGGGVDAFVFALGDGLETIADFVPGNAGSDVIVLSNCGVSSFSDLQSHMSGVGNDTVITFDAQNQFTLHNVLMAQLNSADFFFH